MNWNMRLVRIFFSILATILLLPQQGLALETSRASFLKAISKQPSESLRDFQNSFHLGFPRLEQLKGRPASSNELVIDAHGWSLLLHNNADLSLLHAADIFIRDMSLRMGVTLTLKRGGKPEIDGASEKTIRVGDRQTLPACAIGLESSKDYRLQVHGKIVDICGFDNLGAVHGIYNLYARYELADAPIIDAKLNIPRRSLFGRRIAMSGLGSSTFPDAYLETLSRAGFDGIFASIYANADGSAPPELFKWAHRQHAGLIQDLMTRASRFGIRVYLPLLFRLEGLPSDEPQLRALVDEHLRLFPRAAGFILLTEGFYFKSQVKFNATDQETRAYAEEWLKGIRIVEDQIHRSNPAMEVLAWDYSFNFFPQSAHLKSWLVSQYPANVIPLITWENGKEFERDGEKSYLSDYSINEIGPSEVAKAQIDESRRRGIPVFAKADTSASWQFGSLPFIPAPQQWLNRYAALDAHKIQGTLESWTYGFQPNFVNNLRTWTAWSNAPEQEFLLRQMGKKIFGTQGVEAALSSWKEFSAAIQIIPDTGHGIGTNSSIVAPMLVTPSEPRVVKSDEFSPNIAQFWSGAEYIDPTWPHLVSWMWIKPDFSGKTNSAAQLARNFSLPVYRKYMQQTLEKLQRGLTSYRKAALAAPSSRKAAALKEVGVAEMMALIVASSIRHVDFETARFNLASAKNRKEGEALLNSMRQLLTAELSDVEVALLLASKDSRIGFHTYYGRIISPYNLQQKAEQLKQALAVDLPKLASRFTTPQTPLLLSTPAKMSPIGYARFAMQVNGGQLECRLGQVEFANCDNPQIYPNLPNGPHRFEVRIRNAARDVSNVTVFEWKINTP
jgi:hypothetical protein